MNMEKEERVQLGSLIEDIQTVCTIISLAVLQPNYPLFFDILFDWYSLNFWRQRHWLLSIYGWTVLKQDQALTMIHIIICCVWSPEANKVLLCSFIKDQELLYKLLNYVLNNWHGTREPYLEHHCVIRHDDTPFGYTHMYPSFMLSCYMLGH